MRSKSFDPNWATVATSRAIVPQSPFFFFGGGTTVTGDRSCPEYPGSNGGFTAEDGGSSSIVLNPTPVRGKPQSNCGIPWRHRTREPVQGMAVRVCGRGAFGEIALPRRCLGEVGFSATQRSPEDLLTTPRCGPRTSEIGSDFRVVRVCGSPISAEVRVCGSPISAEVRVCGHGAFGEIALPRRCLGEVGVFRPPRGHRGGEASIVSSAGNGGFRGEVRAFSTKRRQAARSLGLMAFQRSALRRNCSRSAGLSASNF